ncbi:MAG: hypothetical protein RR620_14330 [Clostridium sp.]
MRENIKIFDNGLNNNIRIDTYNDAIKSISVTIDGDGNTIIFEEGGQINNVVVSILLKGNNNRIFIGRDYTIFKSNIILYGDNQKILVGEDAHFGGVSLNAQENTSIEIGNNSMFAYETQIRTTDSHSLLDNTTGKRINYAKSIKIGDRVWMGTQVMICKGVILGNDIVLGAKSLVNKSFSDNNIVIAGVPAKVVKENIRWVGELI